VSLPAAIRTARWMVRDTFRQAVSTRLAWVMLGVTLVATAVCASVSVTGDQVPAGERDGRAVITPQEATRKGHEAALRNGIATLSDADAEALGREIAAADGVRVAGGEVSFGFGAVTVPLARGREDAVRQMELLLAGVVGDTLGVLLALLWTAGFLPSFLEPQSATVLLAKPAPRWSLLLGKYVGVCLFVGLNAVLFVGGTWSALGLRTGVWPGAYWLAVPLLLVNFGVFYAVSAFLAVWTRNAVAAAFGTLLFWALGWATNFTHHTLLAFPPEGLSAGSNLAMEVAYWVLPKPLDLQTVFYDAMGADAYADKPAAVRVLQETGRFHAGASVAASAAFAAATLAAAAYEFEMTDY
jgi:hypothetical protein